MGAQGTTTTFDYVMPSLGADMDVGRVINWRVEIGDLVHRGDVMAVVETEKSDIDIEIWHDGVVEEFLVERQREVPVGTPIVRLRHPDATESDDGRPTAPTHIAPASPAPASPAPASPAPVPPSRPGRGDRVLASPLARRLASERRIDLSTVVGSGPGGAVVEADLARGPEPAPVRATADSGSRTRDTMRRLISERMSKANREIPHYYLERDIDVAPLGEWLTDLNEERSIADRVLPAAVFIRAVALAARRHPELNGHWIADAFVPGEHVNVAMAISLRSGGLVTPKIEAAEDRTIGEIMSSLRELVAAARTGTLRASWMSGSTITITNLGDTGADLVHGVISPPEVALVGFGRTVDRPWVVDGAVVPRPIITATLAADHRATDGAIGSRFLTTLAHLLEHPEEL